MENENNKMTANQKVWKKSEDDIMIEKAEEEYERLFYKTWYSYYDDDDGEYYGAPYTIHFVGADEAENQKEEMTK